MSLLWLRARHKNPSKRVYPRAGLRSSFVVRVVSLAECNSCPMFCFIFSTSNLAVIIRDVINNEVQ